MITVLSGGTGGAKFIEGLAQVVPPEQMTIIVNVGDDLLWWGLQVCPDLDSVTYALAGMLSKERGWGVEGDTYQCQGVMGRLGAPTWFTIGDRDLATHLFRSQQLVGGKSLSDATAEMTRRFGVKARILPATDDRVETRVQTPVGELSFEEYFVQRWYQDPVSAVRFAGIEEARPAPGVIEAIEQAEAVLLAPSNPVTSIGLILAVAGIREALSRTSAPVAAVSPIVAGKAVSGPAGVLMQAVGLPVSIAGVAQAYAGFLDLLVVDEADAGAARELRTPELQVECAPTIMKTLLEKAALAKNVLDMVARRARSRTSEQPA